MTIRFTDQDLRLFREASHDANPLHVSADYARATAYGEPVVFGILGALAGAGCLRDRPNWFLKQAELEFCNPLHTDIDYRAELRKDLDDEALILVFDASRLMAKLKYRFRPDPNQSHRSITSAPPPRAEAVAWSPADLRPGVEVCGTYGSSKSLISLMDRWGLSAKGFHWDQLTVLLWSSYFIGMELPGKHATFWKARIEFNPAGESTGEMTYQARLQHLDERFDLLESNAILTIAGQSFARAKLWAFHRKESAPTSTKILRSLLLSECDLTGKVAVVVGGSRGLGAATALALALSGCTVYVIYERSGDQAERLRSQSSDAPGEIQTVQASATDVERCRDLRQEVERRHGGLDILICNASPPIEALSFAPETMTRFQSFVDQSLALVSVPLSVFLPSLNEKSGWAAIVSSGAIHTNPGQWPHYVTAKHAIEGLAHWSAAQFKKVGFLLVRPPKLLTDQTNTPQGRHGATAVEIIAAAVANRLAQVRAGQSIEVMETFETELGSAEQDRGDERIGTPAIACH